MGISGYMSSYPVIPYVLNYLNSYTYLGFSVS